MSEDLKAKTSDGVPFYTKIDFGFLKELAETLTTGTYRYDPHLMVENWRLGDSAFFYKRANHAVEHIFKWLSGDRTENHLTHAAANLMMLHWAAKQGIFDPPAPEISAMQWVAFVRANQEKKEEVTSPPVVKEETKNEEIPGVEIDELLPEEESIDYVSAQGKPVINVAKATEILLG